MIRWAIVILIRGYYGNVVTHYPLQRKLEWMCMISLPSKGINHD